MPIAGSVISIFGRPHSLASVDSSNILVITVGDIIYNPGSTQVLVDGKSDVLASPRRLQVKNRSKPTDDFECEFLFFFFFSLSFVDGVEFSTGDSKGRPVFSFPRTYS